MRLSHFDESDFSQNSRGAERGASNERLNEATPSPGSPLALPAVEFRSAEAKSSESKSAPRIDSSVSSTKRRWDEPPLETVPKRARPAEAVGASSEESLPSDHILSGPPTSSHDNTGSNVLLAGQEPAASPTELKGPAETERAAAPVVVPTAASAATPAAASDQTTGNGTTIDKAAVAREVAAALAFRNQGDYVRAIAGFTAALRLDPACAEAYAHRGAALRLMGDYPRAIADCSAAVAHDRNLVIAYENRGAVYRTTNETAKAVADFSEVIRLDPRNTLAFSQRGNALGELGESALAIDDYSSAIKLDPRSLWSWQSRGLAYAAIGAHLPAVSDFSEVLRLDARSVLALYQRGDARLRLGQTDQAIADFTAALALEPNHALALARRAQARQTQGNLDLALADFDLAIELEPNHIENLHSRGLIHRLRGDLDRALADLDRVLELDPNHQPAANNRGNLHFARGDFERAISDYSVAVRLDPQFARGYANRGNVYFTRGDWEQAVADYTEAIRSDARFARAYMNRGLAQARLERYKEVIADCTEAIKLDPELAPPYYYRGHAHAKLRQYDAALLDFNQSLLRDPRDYLSYIDRGLLYAKLKDYERAIDDYTSALQLEPRNALIYANRAIAHRNLDEHAQALSDTARAAALDPKYALSYISQQARTHAAAGDFRRAAADFTVALALDPDSAELKRERELALQAAGPLDVEPANPTSDTDEIDVSEPEEAEAASEAPSQKAKPLDVDEFLLEELPDSNDTKASSPKPSKPASDAQLADDLADFLLDLPPKKGQALAAAAPAPAPAAKPVRPAAQAEPEQAQPVVVSLKKKPKTPLGSQIWDAKELGALVREGIKNTPEGNRSAAVASGSPSPSNSGVNLGRKEGAKKPVAAEDRASAIESLLFDEAPVSSMTRTTPAGGTSIRTKSQTQILKKPVAVEEPAKSETRQPLIAKVEPLPSSPAAAVAESKPVESKPAAEDAPATIPFPQARGLSGKIGKKGLTGVAAAVFLLAAGYLLSEFALGGGDSGSFGHEVPTAAALSTREFCREYLNDNKTANVKFAGKILRIRGKVHEVVTDKNPRLVFTPLEEGSWTVECMFGHPTGLKGVAVNNEVVILGECQLRTKPDGNVQLYNCQIKSGS